MNNKTVRELYEESVKEIEQMKIYLFLKEGTLYGIFILWCLVNYTVFKTILYFI